MRAFGAVRKTDLPSDGAVTLDDFSQSDAIGLFAADQDAEHRRRFEAPEEFLPSLQHSRQTISRWLDEKNAGTRWALAVRDCKTRELLGGCEFKPVTSSVTRLSYWTLSQHRAKGIGSRAVALACTLAFEQLQFHRIELSIDADNPHSRSIALRNGFLEHGAREGRVLYAKEQTGKIVDGRPRTKRDQQPGCI